MPHGYSRWLLYYRVPDRAAKYRDVRVSVFECVHVCRRAYLRKYTSNVRQMFGACYGCGSVLLW